MLEDWIDQEYRFVVRLRGDRDLMRFYEGFGGPVATVQTQREGQWVRVETRQLAEQTPTPHRSWRTVKRRGKVILRFSQVGWVKVRLPGREQNLTMVVARSPGNDVPFMLLRTFLVESVDDARRVLSYYARRWECEEGIRFLKSEVNLKRIRTFNWTAICRLVLLCVLVMLYLTWVLERKGNLADRLIALGQPLPDEPDFLLYLLLTGLTEAITACVYAGRVLP
ncbi:MAG: transposase [Planctomycetes bacterium]|nr:transposase [Planctomycetota bacterium]